MGSEMPINKQMHVLTAREKCLRAYYPDHLASGVLAAAHIPSCEHAASPFVVYESRAHAILGDNPDLECVLRLPKAAHAHEAGVYLPRTKEVLVTSNRVPGGIRISSVSHGRDGWTITDLGDSMAAAVPMANGAVNLHPDMESVVFCAQGTLLAPAGLVRLSRHGGSWTATPLLDHFLGRPFNSPNDVAFTQRDGGLLWFTDPAYGFEQGFRPRPRLPAQVYSFDARGHGENAVRVVADGFRHPNGITFSPDEETCYITDTDRVGGNGGIDDTLVSTM